MWLRDLAIDQGIIKTDVGCVSRGVGKINARQPSPVDRPQTHGTGLTRGINLAAFKIENAKLLAALANGEHFRVRSRIIRRSHLVHAFANNYVAFHHRRTEGPTASPKDVVD